jgi:hypothetical protein
MVLRALVIAAVVSLAGSSPTAHLPLLNDTSSEVTVGGCSDPATLNPGDTADWIISSDAAQSGTVSEGDSRHLIGCLVVPLGDIRAGGPIKVSTYSPWSRSEMDCLALAGS